MYYPFIDFTLWKGRNAQYFEITKLLAGLLTIVPLGAHILRALLTVGGKKGKILGGKVRYPKN